MRRHQHLADLGPLLKEFGVRSVIICPGSRSAPLTQLFTAHKDFQCYSIVDERSAGYVALGMVRQLQEPVVVLTTSGTAVLNLAPALAEAFHQQLPLIIITADRPSEKFTQFNNQIIDQQAPFYNYSKGFFQVPCPVSHEESHAQVMIGMERLCASALSFPHGPVHINILLDEPLYDPLPEAGKPIDLSSSKQEEKAIVPEYPDLDGESRIMVLAGMGSYDAEIIKELEELQAYGQVVLIAENIANLPGEGFISRPELLLAGLEEEKKAALIPDLLISFGAQVVSKRLKLLLQAAPDLRHVEIDGNVVASIKKVQELLEVKQDSKFREFWTQAAERAGVYAGTGLENLEYGSLLVIHKIISSAPGGAVIHLGNSTSIRYSQLLPTREDLDYYSNRGTSGIDGCVSAAVGAAMVSDKLHILLVGDLSFVYDSNALWNRVFPANLKIVILNDQGGGIFRLLKGPSEMDFFEAFSVAHHPVSPALLSESFGRESRVVQNQEELEELIPEFFTPGSSLSVLDVDTSREDNSRIFKTFLEFKIL